MALLANYIDFFESFPVKKLKSVEKQIKQLYNDFKTASKNIKFFLENLEENVSEINLISQIPGSHLLNSKYVTKEIREEVLNNASYVINYSFLLFKRRIYINIISLQIQPPNLKEMREDIKLLYLWFYVALMYANEKCGKDTVTIYIYKTDFKREVPKDNIFVFGPDNINGGLSDTCRKNSEMAIFRNEEWIKVVIHESFHNFGLDFSAMNIFQEISYLKKAFKIPSDMLFFESYTEAWAEIINVSILCFENTSNFKNFYNSFTNFMRYERVFSLFQCVKVLEFYGLTVDDLKDNSESSILKKKSLYKEETNVFCYYILKNFIIQNYDNFILWCEKNNLELLQFNNTPNNVMNFAKFIEEMVNTSQEYNLMQKVYREKFKNNNLFKTMRMSVCDLSYR